MGGGCNYPIGAHSYVNEGKLMLEGIVLSLDGKKSIKHRVESSNLNEDLSIDLSKKFNEENVRDLINEIDNEIK